MRVWKEAPTEGGPAGAVKSSDCLISNRSTSGGGTQEAPAINFLQPAPLRKRRVRRRTKHVRE